MEANEKLVERVLKEGHEIADKIQSAKTALEIDNLSDRIERYCDFVNENFGISDEFAKDKNKKYSDLSFYAHMAVEEKENHLDYYNSHPSEVSSGVLDFINYLESNKWLGK